MLLGSRAFAAWLQHQLLRGCAEKKKAHKAPLFTQDDCPKLQCS